MRARGIGLLLGGAAVVIGAAWLWFGRAAPEDDAALPAPPTPAASTPEGVELDDWPAGFGDPEWSRAEVAAPEAGALGADSQTAAALLRVVVTRAGVPFAEPARIVFSRAAGAAPIEELGAAAEHAWLGDSKEVALAVAAGSWSVAAATDELASAPAFIRLPRTQDEPLWLELESPCRWHGVLLLADGAPAADVALRVVCRDVVTGSARSRPDGSFELRALARPESQLEVGDASRAAFVRALDGDCRGAAQLEPIRLPALARLTLEFERTGHEQDAVQVMLQGAVGRSSVRGFAAGAPLQFDDLAPGRYRAFVYVPGARGNLDLHLTAGAQTAAVALRAWPASARPRR
ncbi:MAG: hypothetical protein EPO68_17245 [Planctomycetota bacterium]|nr:MAG: hypothetical protein EPO68_17245 [Planctomycetota bacterium]